MNAPVVAALVAIATGLVAQASTPVELATIAGDAQRTTDQRCAALCALQDLAALDSNTVVMALADQDGAVASTAAAIVRHEWATLPPALFAALDQRPGPAAVLLREFAQAPRPAARSWVQQWLDRDQVQSDLRCLLLAARGEALAMGDVDALFATLIAGEAGDGFHAAAGLLPPVVADALPGRLHALLAAHNLEISLLQPILERMSADGWQRLMGLVVTLPPAVSEQLCRHLVQHDVPAYQERAAAALDGKIPLETIWLLRIAPLLTSAPRRQRLLDLLRAKDAAPTIQARAFDALVEAGCIDPTLLAFAVDGAADRLDSVRRVLDAAVADLPEGWLVDCLSGDAEVAKVVATALVRRPVLGAPIEKIAADALFEAGGVKGPVLEALAMALVHNGSDAVIERIWPRLREDPQFAEYVGVLARRRVPFAHERLLGELAAGPVEGMEQDERQAQLDAVRLALVTLGDRRQLAELVAHAKSRTPGFVRRCAHHARPLDERSGLLLLTDAAAVADDDLAAELIGWAANAEGAEVEARLMELWQSPAPGERQEVALRGLVAGSSRARLVLQLQEALHSGPLVERLAQLAFEVVATMPVPLTEQDATLLAELVLEAPLVDPAGEAARVQRWPDGRFGFPLVAAVAQRLRGVDATFAGAAFERVARRVMAHPQRAALSAQRLLVLWRSFEMEPAVQQAIGGATAALLLALPPPADLGAGPAHWFLIDPTYRAGDPSAAAVHARAAKKALLRLPSERRTARLFLGERDPAAGNDPWAALAAAPFACDAEVARAAGDKTAVAAALALATEFAGRDAATLHRIEDCRKEISR